MSPYVLPKWFPKKTTFSFYWPTFLQDSMNSSMVTTPSLFRSIFWEKNTAARDLLTEKLFYGGEFHTLYSFIEQYIYLSVFLLVEEIWRTVEINLEEAFYMFSRGIVLHSGVCILPHHVIDGFHDVQHLLQRKGQSEKIVLRMEKFSNYIKII